MGPRRPRGQSAGTSLVLRHWTRMRSSRGETTTSRMRPIHALAGLAVACTTFASTAVALPIVPPPSMLPRIELAQTIIVVRHRHPWRVQRWHRWHPYGYWRPRRPWAWGRPVFIPEPPYALLPPQYQVEEPRKHITRGKPKSAKVFRSNQGSVAKPARQTKQRVAVSRPSESTEERKRVIPAKPRAPASRSNLLSCDAAAGMVKGYAFSEVKPVACSGSTYTFQAMRENNAYSVIVDAKSGKLVTVTKLGGNQP
jgi:hypothetical protein